jgi:hypothetical protein
MFAPLTLALVSTPKLTGLYDDLTTADLHEHASAMTEAAAGCPDADPDRLERAYAMLRLLAQQRP